MGCNENLSETQARVGMADPIAFRELYESTSVKLGRICARICGCQHSGQDVLHEVYATVWQRAKSFEPARGSAITWLCRIANNRSIDWVRRRNIVRLSPIDNANTIKDDRPTSEELLLQAELLACALTELKRLKPEYRRAISATILGGRSYADVAHASGVPVGTMKARIRRGLRAIRLELECQTE